jgi:hypothetical protein
MMSGLSKYIEAVEMFWIQYFVAYDNQEQASIARSVRRGFSDYQSTASEGFLRAQQMIAEWWAEVRGDKGASSSAAAIGTVLAYAIGAIVLIVTGIWLILRIARHRVWAHLWNRLSVKRDRSIVDFYDKMLEILAAQGIVRQPDQTPMEFAQVTGSPEVSVITETYNEVRFGNRRLEKKQTAEIEELLKCIIGRI